MQQPTIIFIIGPTAVGKTEVAYLLAKKIKGEIISCDSMQVYRGMGILTSQPPAALQRQIPHHLISIISPAQECSVVKYRRQALQKIREIFKKGKTPIFCGGSGLYMSVFIDGIFNIKDKNTRVRASLHKEADTHGSEYLYQRLKKVDPQAAEKIHAHDARRIIRALEVFLVTGQPISGLQKQRQGLSKDYKLKVFCLDMPRDKLHKRIDARVEGMFRQGLVKEIEKLSKLKLSKTARFAIGIRELKGYFRGDYDLEEVKRLIKRNSRLYAKRQLTWFRKDKRIEWIKLKDKETPRQITRRIWKKLF